MSLTIFRTIKYFFEYFVCIFESQVKIIMRSIDDVAKISKIHNNVRSMINQAQKVMKSNTPLPPVLRSSKSYIEVLIPHCRINNHLKLILQESGSQYHKIERKTIQQSHFSLKNRKNQSVDLSTINQRKQNQSPIFLNKFTDRYQLHSVLNKFESDLLYSKPIKHSKKVNRSLYDKKTINLLPQIPPKSKKSLKLSRESIDQSIRYFATLCPTLKSEDYQNLTKTLEITKEQPKYEEEINIVKLLFRKDSKELKKLEKEEKQKLIKKPKIKINQITIQKNSQAEHQQNKKRQIIEEQLYEPWTSQPEPNYDFIVD